MRILSCLICLCLIVFSFSEVNAQRRRSSRNQTPPVEKKEEADTTGKSNTPQTRSETLRDIRTARRKLRRDQMHRATKKDYDSLAHQREIVIENMAGKNLKGESEIEVVGNGSLQKSLTEGAPFEANTGLGVIYYRNWNEYKFMNNLEIDLVINVASTADSSVAEFNSTNTLTNRRNFGAYILQPLNSKQAVAVNFTSYFGSGDWRGFSHVISGLHARLYASNNVWSNQQDSRHVFAYYFRTGIFHEILPDKLRLDPDRRFSITLGAYYSFRGLGGDMTDDVNKQFRTDILGTDRIRFNGFEFGLGFRLKNIRAEVCLPVIKGGQNRSVPGLTNSQFLTTIRFVGGFPVRLRKEDGDGRKEASKPDANNDAVTN